MSIRMTHPDHGTTHAVGAEVEWNLKNGWKIEPKTPKKVEPLEDEPEPKKRGRPFK